MVPLEVKKDSEGARRLVSRDLEIGYPGRPVAGPISLEIVGGGLCVLLGPNGCGKSTLVRTWLGLQPARRGEIQLLPPGESAYVPQHLDSGEGFPLTVAEAVAMAIPKRLGRAEERALTQEALARVGLQDLAHRAFFELSGGQRQRALTARALVSDSGLLVLDEPTAGTDQESSERIWATLADLAQDPKRIVIVVTHDIFSATHHAKRLLVLEHGAVRDGEVRIG